MKTPDPNKLCRLRTMVENTAGYPLHSPKDFTRLSEELFERTRQLISSSTLMRVWGYIESDVCPRNQTLTALARFAGYRNWDDFCRTDTDNRQSSVVICRRLNTATDIRRGQRLQLRWMPNRICNIVYEGDLRFRVEASENTALQPGATFICPLMIEGEPLYLDNLEQNDIPGSAYVCGKRNGITFTFISNKN